jgi:hypothetical protein
VHTSENAAGCTLQRMLAAYDSPLRWRRWRSSFVRLDQFKSRWRFVESVTLIGQIK